ncbi:MAG TPA: amino acid ABC transporter permease [Acidimicrobiales bacterium]|nr:amino acid ABC transporter permease [Acidimicrobiales bacterium]
MGVVRDNLDVFLLGMRTTVLLTVLSYAAALVIGTVVAACRVSPVPPLRAAGTAYVGVVRNTPLAVLIILFFSGLPDAGVIVQSRFVSAVIVLSAYTGAFVAEALRAGVNSVSRGQAEAARALGLTFPQVLWLVVIPQAFRTVVAPLGSIFIALIKNSSLAALISVHELAFTTQELLNETARPIPVFAGAAAAYLALALPSGVAVARLERALAIRR